MWSVQYSESEYESFTGFTLTISDRAVAAVAESQKCPRASQVQKSIIMLQNQKTLAHNLPAWTRFYPATLRHLGLLEQRCDAAYLCLTISPNRAFLDAEDEEFASWEHGQHHLRHQGFGPMPKRSTSSSSGYSIPLVSQRVHSIEEI